MNYNPRKEALTLEQFRATKTAGLKDAEWCREMGIDEQCVNAAEYAGSTYILIDGENSYTLIIANQDWQSSDLAELEEILYREWYLPECVGVGRDTKDSSEIEHKAAQPRTNTIDSPELRRRLFAWAEAADGKPSEDAYCELVAFIDNTRPAIQVPWVTLNAGQLKAAAHLANSAGVDDPVQGETLVTIWQREPFADSVAEAAEEVVAGRSDVYLSFDDMPEEGIQVLSSGVRTS